MQNRNGIVGEFLRCAKKSAEWALQKHGHHTTAAGDVHCKKNFDKLRLSPRHEHNFFSGSASQICARWEGGGLTLIFLIIAAQASSLQATQLFQLHFWTPLTREAQCCHRTGSGYLSHLCPMTQYRTAGCQRNTPVKGHHYKKKEIKRTGDSVALWNSDSTRRKDLQLRAMKSMLVLPYET